MNLTGLRLDGAKGSGARGSIARAGYSSCMNSPYCMQQSTVTRASLPFAAWLKEVLQRIWY